MAPPDRIPSEFRYWQNIGQPWARRLRRRLRWVFGADPKLPEETVRHWAHSYYDADPVAEAFVEEAYLARGQAEGRALLDRALEHGVDSLPDAPESLRVLFRELEQPPAWVDLERVERGARVFRRYGTHMYSFAGAITLEGYRESSVAKPLAFTGAYTGESANRRFLETAAFWIDVSEPGALAFGGRGMRTALRVRMMHVFVRKRLLAHPQWDLEAWGVPISQGDALLTLMGGSFVPGYGLKVLGYRTTRDEIEAMMHFWRYVGHIMGVQPRWYPANVREALGLMFSSQVKGARTSGSDGANLAHSYLESYAPASSDAGLVRLKKRIEHGVQRGYTSWFLPPDSYRYYGLPRPGLWRLAVPVQLPFVFARETLRRSSPRLDEWVDERARASTKRWLAEHLGARRAEYRAAETLTR